MRYNSTRRSGYDNPVSYIAATVVIVIAIAGFGSYWFSQSQKISNSTVTVCSKERVNSGSNSQYMVYTADKFGMSHTYTVKDNLLGGARFNSADFYGSLRADTTYDFKVKGYRLGFPFSHFPNILEGTKTSEQHPDWCTK